MLTRGLRFRIQSPRRSHMRDGANQQAGASASAYPESIYRSFISWRVNFRPARTWASSFINCRYRPAGSCPLELRNGSALVR